MGIINSIELRDKLYKRIRVTNYDFSNVWNTREKYQEFQLRPPKEYKFCKNHYESKFNKYVSNLKQPWTTLNELLN